MALFYQITECLVFMSVPDAFKWRDIWRGYLSYRVEKIAREESFAKRKRADDEIFRQSRAQTEEMNRRLAAWWQEQREWDKFFAKVEWDRAKDGGVPGVARYYVKRWRREGQSYQLTPAGKAAVGVAGIAAALGSIRLARRLLRWRWRWLADRGSGRFPTLSS